MTGSTPNNNPILQESMKASFGKQEEDKTEKKTIKYITGERNSSVVLVMYDKNDGILI